jgi:hypothetical protein
MDNNRLTLYSVGDKVCAPSNDETRFTITDEGALLLFKLRRPTAAEKREIKNGVFQSKLAMVDGIIFFLFRFGTGPWNDAPYYSRIEEKTLVAPGPGQGLALHFMFIDAETGILLQQRLIGLDHDLSLTLLHAASQQPEMSIQDYYSRVAEIYARHSTEDLLRNHLIFLSGD